MKPILFLDIDGVLNTRPGSLDLDKLELLEKIVRESGCEIILSSTWRKTDNQFQRIKWALYGLRINIDGYTPIVEEKVGSFLLCPARWVEIVRWFESRTATPTPRFVILDDEPDMGPLGSHHAHVESHIGLTQEIAREITRRLKGEEVMPLART